MKLYRYCFLGDKLKIDEYTVESIVSGRINLIGVNEKLIVTKDLKILQFLSPPISLFYSTINLSKSQVDKLRKVLFKCRF